MPGCFGDVAPFSLGAMAAHGPAGPILAAIGTAVSAGGSIISANAQARNSQFEARQLDMKAREERASASRDAAEQAKKQALVMSRQQAVAAASGGGASDPTLLDLIGDTAAQGFQQRGTTLALGENRALGYEDAAAAKRAEAKNARIAGVINAGSTLLKGTSAAFDEYGKSMMSNRRPLYDEEDRLPTYGTGSLY